MERDIMGYLIDEKLLKLEDIAQLNRSFNYLMLRLCENCNKTTLFGSVNERCVGVGEWVGMGGWVCMGGGCGGLYV